MSDDVTTNGAAVPAEEQKEEGAAEVGEGTTAA
jgi:hypothetical protein